VLDDSYFEVSSFENFDFPVVDMMLVHDMIGVIVFVDAYRGVHLNSATLIVFKGEVGVPMSR